MGGGTPGYGDDVVVIGPRKAREPVGFGAPEVREPLSHEMIKRVVDGNKNQIRYCYERELQMDQALEGRVVVGWVIAATGAVEKVAVRESTINNSKVERCIIDRIKTWRFPAPAGGGTVDVSYPFVLTAS